MEQFKQGDKVEFTHAGSDLSGEVIEIVNDKFRIKDSDGYKYVCSPENIRIANTPPLKKEDQNKPNINQQVPQGQHTMSTKKKNGNGKTSPEKKANGNGKPASSKKTNGKENPTSINNGTVSGHADEKSKIVSLTCRKHQRIFLLHSIGIDKKEIMQLAGANAGEVYNVIKSYNESPEKAETANKLLA